MTRTAIQQKDENINEAGDEDELEAAHMDVQDDQGKGKQVSDSD